MIHSDVIYALIDPSSTFLYITSFITSKLDMNPKLLTWLVEVSMPVGNLIIASHIYQDCIVLINKVLASVDLLELTMLDFNIVWVWISW